MGPQKVHVNSAHAGGGGCTDGRLWRLFGGDVFVILERVVMQEMHCLAFASSACGWLLHHLNVDGFSRVGEREMEVLDHATEL